MQKEVKLKLPPALNFIAVSRSLTAVSLAFELHKKCALH